MTSQALPANPPLQSELYGHIYTLLETCKRYEKRRSIACAVVAIISLVISIFLVRPGGLLMIDTWWLVIATLCAVPIGLGQLAWVVAGIQDREPAEKARSRLEAIIKREEGAEYNAVMDIFRHNDEYTKLIKAICADVEDRWLGV